MSIRMNDTHYIGDPAASNTFWQKHPELRRTGGGGYDFAQPAVRDHYLALVEELAKRYDCDGVELDWMRFPHHFKPGQEQAGRKHLTDFMHSTHALAAAAAARRGHPVKIAARIPAVPEAALALGMDGVTWIKEGLADMLVLSAVWRPSDTDIPIEWWRGLIGPVEHPYLLAAATDLWIQSAPGGSLMKDDLETQRGFTAAMLDRGADLIYLFNHFNASDFRRTCATPDGRTAVLQDEYQALLHTAGRMEQAAGKPPHGHELARSRQCVRSELLAIIEHRMALKIEAGAGSESPGLVGEVRRGELLLDRVLVGEEFGVDPQLVEAHFVGGPLRCRFSPRHVGRLARSSRRNRSR
jgi:hypothetical protein